MRSLASVVSVLAVAQALGGCAVATVNVDVTIHNTASKALAGDVFVNDGKHPVAAFDGLTHDGTMTTRLVLADGDRVEVQAWPADVDWKGALTFGIKPSEVESFTPRCNVSTRFDAARCAHDRLIGSTITRFYELAVPLSEPVLAAADPGTSPK
ncbi:MAG TPA: hypothetical protein VFF73_30615 [Planctomycetota bacterium]|nr:hypothetical protein [Planctomycetota bacterium]